MSGIVEIPEKRVIEVIENSPKTQIKARREQKNGFYNKNYTCRAKSVRGLVLGLISKFRNDAKKGIVYTPKEMEVLWSEVYQKFNELYPENITKIEIIEGWEKGNGEYFIERNFDNDFVVEIWHNEHKEKMVVKKEDLNRMLMAVRKMDIGKVYKCYDIAKFLGYDWKTIWANRMNVYFPKYYAPLKILDRLEVVKYGGNHKTIVRLK